MARWVTSDSVKKGVTIQSKRCDGTRVKCCITLLDTSRRDTGSQPRTAKLFFSSFLCCVCVCVCARVCIGRMEMRRDDDDEEWASPHSASGWGESVYTHTRRGVEREIGLGRTRSTTHANHYKANESHSGLLHGETAFSSFTQYKQSSWALLALNSLFLTCPMQLALEYKLLFTID